MTPISNNASTNGVTTLSAADKAAKENSADGIQSRFYTLLLTQIKNQDPLNPMDNSAVTSQMTQLSTLTSIEKMNASLATLNTSMRTSMISQASTVLGNNVVTEGKVVDISQGKGSFGLDVPSGTQKIQITLTDSVTGNIVKTITKTAPEAGLSRYEVNDLPDGRYTLAISALDKDGNDAPGSKSYIQSRVTSLIPGDTDITLTLANGETTDMSKIKQISLA